MTTATANATRISSVLAAFEKTINKNKQHGGEASDHITSIAASPKSMRVSRTIGVSSQLSPPQTRRRRSVPASGNLSPTAATSPMTSMSKSNSTHSRHAFSPSSSTATTRITSPHTTGAKYGRAGRNRPSDQSQLMSSAVGAPPLLVSDLSSTSGNSIQKNTKVEESSKPSKKRFTLSTLLNKVIEPKIDSFEMGKVSSSAEDQEVVSLSAEDQAAQALLQRRMGLTSSDHTKKEEEGEEEEWANFNTNNQKDVFGAFGSIADLSVTERSTESSSSSNSDADDVVKKRGNKVTGLLRGQSRSSSKDEKKFHSEIYTPPPASLASTFQQVEKQSDASTLASSSAKSSGTTAKTKQGITSKTSKKTSKTTNSDSKGSSSPTRRRRVQRETRRAKTQQEDVESVASSTVSRRQSLSPLPTRGRTAKITSPTINRKAVSVSPRKTTRATTDVSDLYAGFFPKTTATPAADAAKKLSPRRNRTVKRASRSSKVYLSPSSNHSRTSATSDDLSLSERALLSGLALESLGSPPRNAPSEVPAQSKPTVTSNIAIKARDTPTKSSRKKLSAESGGQVPSKLILKSLDSPKSSRKLSSQSERAVRTHSIKLTDEMEASPQATRSSYVMDGLVTPKRTKKSISKTERLSRSVAFDALVSPKRGSRRLSKLEHSSRTEKSDAPKGKVLLTDPRNTAAKTSSRTPKMRSGKADKKKQVKPTAKAPALTSMTARQSRSVPLVESLEKVASASWHSRTFDSPIKDVSDLKRLRGSSIRSHLKAPQLDSSAHSSTDVQQNQNVPVAPLTAPASLEKKRMPGSLKDRLKAFESPMCQENDLVRLSAESRLRNRERREMRAAGVIQAWVRPLLARRLERRTKAAILIQAFGRGIPHRLRLKVARLERQLVDIEQNRQNEMKLLLREKWEKMEEMRKDLEQKRLEKLSVEDPKDVIKHLERDNSVLRDGNNKLMEMQAQLKVMSQTTEQTVSVQKSNLLTMQEAVAVLSEKSDKLTKKEMKAGNAIDVRTQELEELRVRIKYETAVRMLTEKAIESIVECVSSRSEETRLVKMIKAMSEGEFNEEDYEDDEKSLASIFQTEASEFQVDTQTESNGFDLSFRINDLEDDEISALEDPSMHFSAIQSLAGAFFGSGEVTFEEVFDGAASYEEIEVIEEEVYEEETVVSEDGEYSCDSSAYVERSSIIL